MRQNPQSARLRRRLLAIAVVVFVAALAFIAARHTRTGSVGNVEAETTRTFFAMDTVMTVSCGEGTRELMDDCQREVQRLEAVFSVTGEGEIAALNASGSAELSDEALSILSRALDVCERTDGALDVTLYPIVRAWGFTTGEYRVPDAEEIRALLESVDWRGVSIDGNRVTLRPGSMIDLGAVVKGYASDRLAALLRERGVTSALIDLGGNVYCVGAKENGDLWRVGIRDPEDADGYIGVVRVRDRAVITSGSYERFFTGEDGAVYGHIFDASTGHPAESGLASVTVIGEDGFTCDALTTALYVMGVDRATALLATANVDAILATEDGALYATEGLRDSLTLAGRWQRVDVNWIDNGGA